MHIFLYAKKISDFKNYAGVGFLGVYGRPPNAFFSASAVVNLLTIKLNVSRFTPLLTDEILRQANFLFASTS